MSGDIEHVVSAANDPKISIAIAACAVSGEIPPFEFAPVLFLIAFLVAVDRAQHRWPWLSDDQFPAYICAHFFSTFVYHGGIDPKKRQGCASGFGRNCAWQWRDHDGACLRLPPSINDRTAPAPNRLLIPHPGFGIDRFAHRTKKAQ